MCPSDSANLPIKNIILHRFTIGDVEDPYVTAAFPLAEWQQTDKGKWCMEHAVGEMKFYCAHSEANLQTIVIISGDLMPEDHTYFLLKWGAWCAF